MRIMADTRAPVARPLSPHLQIYRPMLTMMMSIVHRITGFGPTEREWLVAANLVGSIVITLILWVIGLLALGGTP